MEKIEENEQKVLIGMIVQQFQPITSKEVIKTAEKIGYELEYDNVVYTLKNMQRRDIASIIYKTVNNQKLEAYGMAKPMFKKCPEIAQMKDMLPTLIKSKDAKNFLKALEGESSDTKKVKELGYRDYKLVTIKLKTIAPIVGGSLNKPKIIAKEIEPEVDKIEKKLKEKQKSKDGDNLDAIAYIDRDSESKVFYPSNRVRQYFLKNLRVAGIGESAINQIDFSDAAIETNGHKFYLEQWAVIINGMGRGVKTAEALPAGIELTITMNFPFTGTKIKDPETLKKVIEYQARHGRGFSSYSKKFGKCELIDFKVEKLPWE